MRAAGAIFVAAALFAAAMNYIRRELRHIHELTQLCEVLDHLTMQLRTGPYTLAELFSDPSNDPSGEVDFMYRVKQGLGELGDRSFSEIWRSAAQKSIHELDERERKIFLRVGDRLGNGSRDCQLLQLQLGSDALTKELSRATERFSQNRRLALGLSAALGAVTVIIFI